ncbi:MAG: peptidylprolyl isomerase [Planctomycetota bacterium]|nr:peptidylprolyl isomerase [Planctomycetota bacterium]
MVRNPWLLWAGSLLWVACAGAPKQERPSLEETRAVYQDKARGPEPENHSEPEPATWQETLEESAAPATLPSGSTVATVAGQEITAQDLLASWMFRDSTAVRGLLDRLVLDGLVRAEASRLGLRLPPELVAREWNQLVADYEQEVQKSAPGLTMDRFIESRLGMDPARYRQRMEARSVLDLLAERCVRAFTLESESVRAKMIVVPTRAEADRVEAGLTMGREFGDLATQFSQDPSAQDGGAIPPIVRSQAAISRLAFATPIGEVGGPLVENGRHIYLQVEAVVPGKPGPWSDLGPRVEASLQSLPIEDLEFLQWQAMVSARYEVDTSALLRMVGEPAAAGE